MKELELKYGCNPNQKPARVSVKEGDLPFAVLNGQPGYINLLDALNGWQLVRELRAATGLPAAASFKHVSPAGAAVSVPLSEAEQQSCFVEGIPLTPLSTAYIRARGSDRMSSYGDFAVLSDECDAATAAFLAREVSDGVIAPSYSEEARAILQKKKKGRYLILQMDPDYEPEETERREIFGITFEQGRNTCAVTPDLFRGNIPTRNQDLTGEALRDLTVALITLKYTQSNSVCYVKNGQAIGVGAGQQSRIHCTRLAGNKADNWFLRQHPQVLSLPFRKDLHRPDRDNAVDVYLSEDSGDVLREGAWQSVFTERPQELTRAQKREWLDQVRNVALGSDAFFPFGDNIERAHKSGVRYVAEAGGSIRDEDVIAACDRYDICLSLVGIRLFHH